MMNLITHDDLNNKLDSMKPVEMAMAVINFHKLQQKTTVAGERCTRFIPVDKDCHKVKADNAVAIYDMQYGMAFIPQINTEWINQLAERFRISNIWHDNENLWESRIQVGEARIGAMAKTIGEAQIRVMMSAAILKLKLKKEDWS